MDIVTLGGNLLGTIPLGDIVLYLTPFNLFLFAVLLGFTALIAFIRYLRYCICRSNDYRRSV